MVLVGELSKSLGGDRRFSFICNLPPVSPRKTSRSILAAITGRQAASYAVSNPVKWPGGWESSGRSSPDGVRLRRVSPLESCAASMPHRPRSSEPGPLGRKLPGSVQAVSSVDPFSLPAHLPAVGNGCEEDVSRGGKHKSHDDPGSFAASPKRSSVRSLCAQMHRSASYSGSPGSGSSPSLEGASYGSDCSLADFEGDFAQGIPRSLSCSSCPPAGSSLRQTDGWLLCTGKRPRTNRRVAAMNSFTLKDNVEQYRKWMSDAPKGKANRLAGRSRNSFRSSSKHTKDTSNACVSGTAGSDKVVKIECHTNGEDLEKKLENLVRFLDYHHNAVRKGCPDVLSGAATILLESVVQLYSALTSIFGNTDENPEVSSKIHSLQESIARLIWWSDECEFNKQDVNSGDIEAVSNNLKELAKALVQLAANKENEDSFSISAEDEHSSDGSSCLQPESSLSRRGSHSLNGSLSDIPPPIPPKKKHHKTSALNPELLDASLRLHHESPVHTPDFIGDYPRRSTGSLSSSGTPQSLEQEFMSPASSHDSVNATCREDKNHSFSSGVCHLDDDGGRFNSSHLLSRVTVSLGTDDLSSILENMHSLDISLHSDSDLGPMSPRLDLRYNSHCQEMPESLSSADQDQEHSIRVPVPPDLPYKRKNKSPSFAPDRVSHYDNYPHSLSHCSCSEKSVPVRNQRNLSPELPPKKGIYCRMSPASSGYGSASCSLVSASSSSTTSSSSLGMGSSSATVIVRRKEWTEFTCSDDRPPLPPKASKHVSDYLSLFNQYETPPEFPTRASLQVACRREEVHCQSVNTVEHTERYSLPPELPPKMRSKPCTDLPVYQNQSFGPEVHVLEESVTALASSHSAVPVYVSTLNGDHHVTTTCPSVAQEDLPQYSDCLVNPLSEEGDRKSFDKDSYLEDAEIDEDGLLECLDVREHLVWEDKEYPKVKAGSIDALVVYAASIKTDCEYQRAFLTTYRTFITPERLVAKLFYRYKKLVKGVKSDFVKAARSSFSLLILVVDDLVLPDLNNELIYRLRHIEHDMIIKGDLQLVKVLRKKLQEKLKKLKEQKRDAETQHPSILVAKEPRNHTLLDFKSESIAIQMTLLDWGLFEKLSGSELLQWAKAQNEELCPNLVKFTTHFNMMSYWVQSTILKQTSAQEREKYLRKYIKVTKHLRKKNNFNSYLAVISALNSSSVLRLDMPKAVKDSIREFSMLIDHSKSFKNYREALAEVVPPCIPNLALILMDLTFIHQGNPDFTDGKINFSKRWQQYATLANLSSFKSSMYKYTKDPDIIEFFNNFEDILCEDKLWELSCEIKPRGEESSTKRLD